MRIAILGANGFIGGRTVEMFHLNEWAEVRPVVRRLAALAPLSRFDLDCRIADAFDTAGLRAAFTGCDIVVHAVAGDRKTILGTLAPTYRAAQEAGVRRLVYLSTASVHGQTFLPDTNEESPLNDRQLLPYNNSKVEAERKLRHLRNRGSVEVVMLRPGLVTGPRSSWIIKFADDLLAGRAYLINRGLGICNSIYIDNLVHAIFLSATGTGIDEHAFLVGDQETVTWADLYRPIARALGFDIDRVPDASLPAISATPLAIMKKFYSSEKGQAILSVFPARFKQAARSALSSYFRQPEPQSPWIRPSAPRPEATREMALLYQCQYKLPLKKAEKILGYRPIVSFNEGCRRSVAWMAFAGYPMAEAEVGNLKSVPGEKNAN